MAKRFSSSRVVARREERGSERHEEGPPLQHNGACALFLISRHSNLVNAEVLCHSPFFSSLFSETLWKEGKLKLLLLSFYLRFRILELLQNVAGFPFATPRPIPLVLNFCYPRHRSLAPSPPSMFGVVSYIAFYFCWHGSCCPTQWLCLNVRGHH